MTAFSLLAVCLVLVLATTRPMSATTEVDDDDSPICNLEKATPLFEAMLVRKAKAAKSDFVMRLGNLIKQKQL